MAKLVKVTQTIANIFDAVRRTSHTWSDDKFLDSITSKRLSRLTDLYTFLLFQLNADCGSAVASIGPLFALSLTRIVLAPDYTYNRVTKTTKKPHGCVQQAFMTSRGRGTNIWLAVGTRAESNTAEYLHTKQTYQTLLSLLTLGVVFRLIQLGINGYEIYRHDVTDEKLFSVCVADCAARIPEPIYALTPRR